MIEEIKLNLIPNGVSPVCHVSQYDAGRQIKINLFEGINPYLIQSGDTFTLNVRKPDNTIVTTSVSGTQGNNYITISTTQQITAVVGENLCELKITNGSTVIGTLNFIMLVERDVLADGIDSQSVIRDLDTLAEAAVSSAIGDITSFRPYGLPPYMMSLFKPLTNIFSNFDNHISGAYYTGTPATVGNHLAIVTTPNWQGWLIRVKPNTTYTLGGVDFRLLFYNANLDIVKVIQQADLSDTNPNTITSNNDSYWLALTQRITRDMSQYMIVEGDTYPTNYISGFPQFVETPKLSDDSLTVITIGYNATPITIDYTDSDAAVITVPVAVNLMTQKGALQARTDEATVLTMTGNSGYLSFDATAGAWILGSHINGHEIYTLGWVNRLLKKAVLFANYTEIAPSPVSTREWGYCYSVSRPKIRYTTTGATLTIPANTRIMYAGGLITIPNETVIEFTTSNWLCYDVDTETLRTGYSVSNHRLIMLGVINTDRYESSYIAGMELAIEKVIAIFGDSISAGSGTNKVYHEYLANVYGFTCLNYAYGGSGYVQSYESYGSGLMGIGEQGRGVPITADNYFIPNNVLTRLAEVNPSDLDGVIIFAGTNDWRHGNTISFEQFKAGVEAVFNYFQTNFAAVPLLVMTPIHRKDDTIPNSTTGKTLIEYADAIIELCRKYGVPYVDTMSMSGLHPDNAGNDAIFFPRDDSTSHASDGLHPNHIAHERIMRVIGETINALVKYNNTAMR